VSRAPVPRAALTPFAPGGDSRVVDDIFSFFDRADADAEALAPAVRTVLDPAAEPSARAAAVAEIRASGTSFEAALRTICDDDADRLEVARAVFESALSERGASDLESVACFAVETAGRVIRNNVIVADVPWYDTGIELAQARGAVVVHNTILELPGATGSFSSIDTRFDNAITTVRNNLTRRITVRSGTSIADHNLESIDPSLFVDAAGGDLHLAASASAAIDQGVPVAEATSDLDGEPRDDGAPDLGADER
jgi:hypothetical protein